MSGHDAVFPAGEQVVFQCEGGGHGSVPCSLDQGVVIECDGSLDLEVEQMTVLPVCESIRLQVQCHGGPSSEAMEGEVVGFDGTNMKVRCDEFQSGFTVRLVQVNAGSGTD